MDRFDAMRIFTRIAERRSFSLAADDLGLPRSTVTDAVKVLEQRLGVKLLERTTRVVRPTLDGEAYYQRCVRLIADLEDAEAGFSGAKPAGLLRVDLHGTQARYFLLPGLPAFLEDFPDIRLHISETHQPMDLVREGYDCIVRVGALSDSNLIQRKLVELERGTFASPSYLSKFGTPKIPEDLEAGHRMVGLLAPDMPAIAPLAFQLGDEVREMTLPAVITVTGAETNVASACAGLGVIQVPRYRVEAEVMAGSLVEILPQTPPPPIPVSALYSHTRQLSPRLRVFLDWLTRQYRQGQR
ncbi:LysR family transcriptional regulator [Rhizobium lentis]|uniref:LysR family transcriptional regulator n=1 Tax=Rhizobium lentis TaxID=1138194 RepID=A0ABS7IBE8_9HYPH|nr:LysR family transcriptional regulator [Rhizobium lentis]MBX5041190.1 LysR family transcriptional regulator [Rhizobium lentis]MBX5051889.1 LysR family transcriptional regulator [Rhizobium lentis]MBX5071447.1 LysR family transcriptional regulator [Rhizobium lentis]MBX5088445.1 LysR family transcriptional regulator [Rhizobium lentis]MBX5108515.1 LysR family transcriptional regulator [Rhizobium lentis]